MNTKRMEMDLLLHALYVDRLCGPMPKIIESIAVDSRKVVPNSLFVCIEGFTVDGHDYVLQAVEKGATVILASKKVEVPSDVGIIYVQNTQVAIERLAPLFYHMPSNKMTMIGVTGTNGKTTVTNMMHDALVTLGERSATIGTIGFNIQGEWFETENTTPDVLTMQSMQHQALQRETETMTLEVSSHGLIEGRLSGTLFDIAIFTNLSQDHLDFHETMEHYGYAKGLLFAGLGQDVREEKYVILNADDPWSVRYAQMTPHTIYTYSMKQSADFYATDIELHVDGTAFTLHTPEGTYDASLQLVGSFNVANALAVAAALYAKGYQSETIVDTLQTIAPIKGRMEKVETSLPLTMYVDYAHTPDAIEQAIAAITPYKKENQRLLFLIGTGGNRDRKKRPIMAEKASAADYVILTTDDPRDEPYASILSELEVGMTHNEYRCIGDREEAVRSLVQEANEDDILIFAGKGHEDYQIIGHTKYPHSDALIALDEAKKRFK